jgi:hypothetical protein
MSLNFIVDPASAYHSRLRGNKIDPKIYANALVKSEHGLWWDANLVGERSLKKELSKYSQAYDCIVVGSSHVMQVSSHRSNRALTDECKSLLNLGVSGAGIEDHLVLTYLALQEGGPEKIILGIDPWTFVFNADARWSQYEDDYYLARSVILGKEKILANTGNDSKWQEKLVNLISFDYTMQSVLAVREYIRRGTPTISVAPSVNETFGDIHPVLLPDGSLIYSAKYITDAKNTPIPFGGGGYKTSGLLNQNDAIDTYRSLISWIRSKGIEPILLLTPYHENVFKSPDSQDTTALQNTELIVRNLSRELTM